MLLRIIMAILACALVAPGQTADIAGSFNNVAGLSSASANRSPSQAGPVSTATDVKHRKDLPDNPGFSAPRSISTSISDKAMVISPKYAALPSGKVVELQTGKTVTDPSITGTKKTPVDPLSLTGGKRFIATPIRNVRQELAGKKTGASDADAQRQDQTSLRSKSSKYDDHSTAADTFVYKNEKLSQLSEHRAQVKSVIDKSPWGPYWSDSNGNRAFYNARGQRFLTQARYVIDVSEWQRSIDWKAVKNSGVQAAIIRLSFGTTHVDDWARRNISEVKRLHIPFGVYMYSCADNASDGQAEAAKMNSLLRSFGVSPTDLSFPVYYDVEYYAGAASGPARASAINAWWARMGQLGWTGRAIYSNTSYLQGTLNQPGISNKVGWVAQYGYTLQYVPSSNFYGWQYSSSGRVSGISTGNVDVNAFGYRSPVSSPWDGSQVSADYLQNYSLPDGVYYLNSAMKTDRALMVQGSSRINGAKIVVGQADQSAAQKFRFRRQTDGSYVITNVLSGKAIEIYANQPKNNTPIDQWDTNAGKNQRWKLLKSPSKGRIYLRSVFDNRVIDVQGGNSSVGTPAISYQLSSSMNQGFYITAADDSFPVNQPVRIVSHQKADMVFDIVGNSRDNGALLDLYSWNSGQNQQFVLLRLGNGIYQIRNVLSGKALDLPEQNGGSGVRPQQYNPNDGANQQWYVLRAKDGGHMFCTPLTGRVLDIPGAKADQGASISLWDPDFNANQSWSVETVSQPVQPSHTDRDDLNQMAKEQRDTLADGQYSIHPLSTPSMALDVTGLSTDDGANVMQWSWNEGKNQLWTVTHDSAGYVSLTNAYSNKVLSADWNTAKNAANVVQQTPNGSYDQKWIAQKQASGLKLISAANGRFVLDVSGGLHSAGTNIGLWTSTGGSNQTWRFDGYQQALTPRQKLDQEAAASRSLVADGSYALRPMMNTALALDVTGGSREDSASVIQWTWLNQANQIWVASHDSSGYLILTSKASGRVLDVYGGMARQGQNIDQYRNHDAYGQKWIPERSGSGLILHSALDDRFVVDVSNMSVSAGGNIELWTRTGGNNQIWRFDPAD